MPRIEMPHMPDDDKLRELVLFICERSQSDPCFGATKLNKLLFYSDFMSYVASGRPITGHAYQALEHGPAPKALLPILQKMKDAGEVVSAKRDHYGKEQNVTIALRSANLSRFSAEEIALVTEIIEECSNTNATQLSWMSHKFIGWKAARRGEDIPYGTALVEDQVEVTESMLKTGEQLERHAKECLARPVS